MEAEPAYRAQQQQRLADAQYLVEVLSKPPFNLDLDVVKLSEHSAEELLQLLGRVFGTYVPLFPVAEVAALPLAQQAERVATALRLAKCPAAADLEQLCRELLEGVNGSGGSSNSRGAAYAAMRWLLLEEQGAPGMLAKRMYVGHHLTMPEIPDAFRSYGDVAEAVAALQDRQARFVELHKEAEAGRAQAKGQPALRQELLGLEAQRERLADRLEAARGGLVVVGGAAVGGVGAAGGAVAMGAAAASANKAGARAPLVQVPQELADTARALATERQRAAQLAAQQTEQERLVGEGRERVAELRQVVEELERVCGASSGKPNGADGDAELGAGLLAQARSSHAQLVAQASALLPAARAVRLAQLQRMEEVLSRKGNGSTTSAPGAESLESLQQLWTSQLDALREEVDRMQAVRQRQEQQQGGASGGSEERDSTAAALVQARQTANAAERRRADAESRVQRLEGQLASLHEEYGARAVQQSPIGAHDNQQMADGWRDKLDHLIKQLATLQSESDSLEERAAAAAEVLSNAQQQQQLGAAANTMQHATSGPSALLPHTAGGSGNAKQQEHGEGEEDAAGRAAIAAVRAEVEAMLKAVRVARTATQELELERDGARRRYQAAEMLWEGRTGALQAEADRAAKEAAAAERRNAELESLLEVAAQQAQRVADENEFEHLQQHLQARRVELGHEVMRLRERLDLASQADDDGATAAQYEMASQLHALLDARLMALRRGAPGILPGRLYSGCEGGRASGARSRGMRPASGMRAATAANVLTL